MVLKFRKDKEVCIDMRKQNRRITLKDMFDTFADVNQKTIKRTEEHIAKGHEGGELSGYRNYQMELETYQGRLKKVTDLYYKFLEE